MERYSELYNINVDSVGLPSTDISFDISFYADERERLLRSDFAEILNSMSVSYNDGTEGYMTMFSDNIIFSNYGIPTLPLGNNNDEIMEIAHSELDVIDVLDISLIEELANTVTGFIVSTQGKMY